MKQRKIEMKLTKLCVLMLAFAGLLFVSCDKDDDSEKNGNGVVDLTLGLKSNYDGVLDLSFSKSNANIGFERVDVNLVNVKFNQFAVGGYDLGAIRIDSVSLSKSSVVACSVIASWWFLISTRMGRLPIRCMFRFRERLMITTLFLP